VTGKRGYTRESRMAFERIFLDTEDHINVDIKCSKDFLCKVKDIS
jgi:hypothetical protein